MTGPETKETINLLLSKNIESMNSENMKETLSKIRGYLYRLSSDLFSKNFIFAYGTLRLGQFNYIKLKKKFGEKEIVYIDTMKLDYVKLHDLGAYPVMINSASPDYVIGDLMYCSSRCFDFIKKMEEEAGYIPDKATLWIKERPEQNFKVLHIPTYSAGKELLKQVISNSQYPKIKSGDWIKYLGETVSIEDSEEEKEKERKKSLEKQRQLEEWNMYD